jgi:glycosyltransferase involved in cell wall biosynthesis
MEKKLDRRLNALVISPQPFFSPRGTPYSVYYRTLITSELGVRIDLLTYGEGQDVDIPNVRIIRIPRLKFLGPIKIGPSLPKLVLDVLLVLWTIGLLLKNKYHFVHAHEEAVFFCRYLKPLFGFKLIYDMHSSLPQQLTNFKFTQSKLLIRLFQSLEDSCLKAADAVITICPDLCEYVQRVLPHTGKNLLIENSIFEPVRLSGRPSPESSGRSADPAQGDPLAKRIAGKRLVVYAGTLEPYQGIDILIKAFRAAIDAHADLFLLIVGGSRKQVEDYSVLAGALGLNGRVHFTGTVPQATAKHYSRLASVLVSPRSRGTNTPLKVYEQLASGIPLVATNIYSHTQVLTPDVAFLVEPTPEDMACGIRRAVELGGAGATIAANARKLYETKYSRPVYEAKMKSLLKDRLVCAE